MSINEESVKRISQLILQTKSKIIKEQDILNLLAESDDYSSLLPLLVKNFKAMGLTLMRTTYLNEKYFVVTIEGKDEAISPTMYGTLAVIIATYKEIGDALPLSQMKVLFASVWDEVDQLIAQEYLSIISQQKQEYLVLTPIGKAAFRNIYKKLDLKQMLNDWAPSRSKSE